MRIEDPIAIAVTEDETSLRRQEIVVAIQPGNPLGGVLGGTAH
jgi:hypothetical protein